MEHRNRLIDTIILGGSRARHRCCGLDPQTSLKLGTMLSNLNRTFFPRRPPSWEDREHLRPYSRSIAQWTENIDDYAPSDFIGSSRWIADGGSHEDPPGETSAITPTGFVETEMSDIRPTSASAMRSTAFEYEDVTFPRYSIALIDIRAVLTTLHLSRLHSPLPGPATLRRRRRDPRPAPISTHNSANASA